MNVFAKGMCESCKNENECKDFTDVTLACDDGKLVEAHKVILAASSPLFQNLLKSKTLPSIDLHERNQFGRSTFHS